MAGPVPRHLALIPDGNRRWARARGLDAIDGHAAGIRAVGDVVEAAWDAGVETVSFWWSSPGNLTRRAPEEVEGIVTVLADWLEGPGSALLRRREACFEVRGEVEAYCPSLRPALEVAGEAAGEGPLRLLLLMAYDGRHEILEAARAGDTSSLAAFERSLWTAPFGAVDLVIRTGGEPHLSAGFLLWWIAEAQLHFSDRTWPDFGKEGLAAALADYARVDRRHGA